MNDVLKSLTVLDLGGGRVSAIGYDSKAPSTRLLSEFGFELPADGALVAMLQRFRGAELEVELVGKKLVGSLAGVELRAVPGGAGAAPLQVPRVSLLVDEGRLVSFDASEIQSARFLDADLRQDVRRYLDVLRDSYRAERKSLQLRLEGKGARDVFVAYTVEVPVWKASYRLVLGEPDLLQGWAIVVNTSDGAERVEPRRPGAAGVVRAGFLMPLRAPVGVEAAPGPLSRRRPTKARGQEGEDGRRRRGRRRRGARARLRRAQGRAAALRRGRAGDGQRREAGRRARARQAAHRGAGRRGRRVGRAHARARRPLRVPDRPPGDRRAQPLRARADRRQQGRDDARVALRRRAGREEPVDGGQAQELDRASRSRAARSRSSTRTPTPARRWWRR
jgi:hypothetical protein